MTTDYNEFIGRIENLYERIYPKPKDPSEEFIRNSIKLNSNNNCSIVNPEIVDPGIELMNQFRNHINSKIIYAIDHPEEYDAYNKNLTEWENTKKKKFPKFKKIYIFKHFLKDNGISSQEDLDNLYMESLTYPNEAY